MNCDNRAVYRKQNLLCGCEVGYKVNVPRQGGGGRILQPLLPSHLPKNTNTFFCRKASYFQSVFPSGGAFFPEGDRYILAIVLVRITVPYYPFAELLLLCFMMSDDETWFYFSIDCFQ